MSVTINAHQLKLLIDKTVDHMGYEDLEQLHGIRLDVDAQYVYTVATDRFTIAAARYRLDHGDQNQEPWSRLIPANHLRTLREWIDTLTGATYITISTTEDARLVFESPLSEFRVAVSLSLEFPDWRGLLRTIAAQTVEGEPFPALDAGSLRRWGAAGQSLRTRITADRKAVMFFGEDFIGAQMPSNGGGIGPAKDQTFDSAHSLWLWTLAAGSKDVDMASLPQPERSRTEATKDVRETGADLLRSVLYSLDNSMEADWAEDREAWHAHIGAGVSSWRAYRYLDALYQVDPRAAQEVVADTAEQLDDGDFGEWAWDLAEEAGHKPKEWKEERERAFAKRMTEEPTLWAKRLARGLNDAAKAGIKFRVDANPHVVFDAEAGAWKATHPQAATVEAGVA